MDFYGRHWKEAIELIRARHVTLPRIGESLRAIAIDTTPPEVEPLLRDILKENPNPAVRAQVALMLAQHLRRVIGEAENMREHPDRFEHAAARFGRESTTRMRDTDTVALRHESEALLEMVIREYNQVRVESDSFYHKLSPAEEARQELRRIRDLVVGKPAPEIVGKGVDGKPTG